MEANQEKEGVQNLYKLLGISNNATLEQIKKGFRKQAMKWHPDKNQSDEAKQMFTHIGYAYEVLSKDGSRKDYDESAEMDVDINFSGTLEGLGQPLSDQFKQFVNEQIIFYQNNRFYNNYDFEERLNLNLKAKIISKKTTMKTKTQGNQLNLINLRSQLITGNGFLGLTKLFIEANIDHLETLKQLDKEINPYKSTYLKTNKLIGFKIYLLEAMIYKVQELAFKCLQKLEDAILYSPTQQGILAITTIISDIQFRKSMVSSLSLENVMISLMSKSVEFGSCLQMSKMLKMIQKFDKETQQMQPLKSAYIYIDFIRAVSSPVQIIGCFVMACIKFLDYMKTASNKEKYAYNKLIYKLCSHVFVISMKYFHPTMQLYAAKAILSILVNANRQLSLTQKNTEKSQNNSLPLFNAFEITLLEQVTKTVKTMYLVCPLSSSKIYKVFDVIYLDVVLRSVTVKFLEKMQHVNDQLIPKEISNYYLFEGTWIGWYQDEFKDKELFKERRIKSIAEFVDKKNWNANQIQSLLHWPMIKRRNGWISEKFEPLQLSGRKYSRIDGLSIDFETGSVELLMRECRYPSKDSQPLFTMEDVEQIFSRGVTASFFTLQAPDNSIRNHPMQQFRYGPSEINQTNYLQTMLHADYLLKMLTSGAQINANYPFEFRNIDEGLTQRLPPGIRQVIKLDSCDNQGQVHRFWIEVEQVPYLVQQTQNKKLNILFGHVKMAVKKNLMKANMDGSLEDEFDLDFDSPEQVFANNFTDYYDQIGAYFPQLLRLPELVKISAAYNFMTNIYKSKKQKSHSRLQQDQAIRQMLIRVRSDIEYPINTQANRDRLFSDTLALNEVSEHQISSSQITRVKNKIRTGLQEQQNNLISNLTNQFKANYHSVSQFDILNLLNYNYTSIQDKIVDQLVQKKQREFSLYERSLSRLKISLTQLDKQESHNKQEGLCNWVPAAFQNGISGRKIYGGVSLFPNLKEFKIDMIKDWVKQYQSMNLNSIISNSNAFIAQTKNPNSNTKLNSEGIDYIMRHQITNQTVYNSKYLNPVKPPGDSGITIGAGTDLGYTTQKQLRRIYSHLSKSDLDVLSKFIGLKGQKAQQAFNKNKQVLSKIEISFEQTKIAFKNSVTKYQKQAQKIFPNCQKQHPKVYAVLISLVYNRGPDISSNKASRKQMLNINKAMNGQIKFSSKAQKAKYIANQIRLMKRLWEGKPGMKGVVNRREDQAQIIQKYM